MTKYNFPDSDVANIVKLHTLNKISPKKIGKIFGIGEKPIVRILTENGVNVIDYRRVKFSKETTERIYKAYESGIGVKGINRFLGLDCSESPIFNLLKRRYGKLRNRSEQQQARMDNATPEEKAHLVKKANAAMRGRKAPESRKTKRAKTLEGKFHFASKWEPVIYKEIIKFFPKAVPSKAFSVYNIDIGIGNSVAVEVFGGGWSITDKRRIDHYIKRTKKIGKSGIHTIFMVLEKNTWTGDIGNLVEKINIASSLPAGIGQYWVIWGNRDGASGLSLDIDHDAFIRPFINIRDRRTGQYVSIPR